MKPTIYLAFGRNINVEHVAFGSRLSGAKPLGLVALEGYELLFRGKATIERKDDGKVSAFLWELTPEDERTLDAYEQWPALCRKEYLPVRFMGKPIQVLVYIPDESLPYAAPDSEYQETMLAAYRTFKIDEHRLLTAVWRTLAKAEEQK